MGKDTEKNGQLSSQATGKLTWGTARAEGCQARG